LILAILLYSLVVLFEARLKKHNKGVK